MTSRRMLMLLLAVGVVAITSRIVMRNSAGSPSPVPALELGLRKTALTDDRVPAAFAYTEAAPGESQRLPRPYDGAPPLIPHSLVGFVPITSENTCLVCHQTGNTDPAGPPQVPLSHRTDFRRAPGVVRETVAGARWNCTACHVMQSNAPVLVGNTFKK